LILKEAPLRDVRKVMFDPEILSRVNVDGSLDRELLIKNATYIGGYDEDGAIFGIFMYYERVDFTTCHFYVLKEHRAKKAVNFARNILNTYGHNELHTITPEFRSEVIRFASHFGFKSVRKIPAGDFDLVLMRRCAHG
jgi:hypothetical protein